MVRISRMGLVKCVVFVMIGILGVSGQFRRGRQNSSPCALSSGDGGDCAPLRDCPAALESLRRGIRPDVCWFDGRNPVVCCQRPPESPSLPGFKSKQKCNETYGIRASKAEGTNRQYGVAAGVESITKTFPHMAALGFGDEDDIKWACGGSLISERFVLTAGHCLNTRDLGEVKFVRLGDLNLRSENDDADPQDFTVVRRIRHPDFVPPSQYHDIGLIELDRAAKFTDYIKPACLQTTMDINNPIWVATGWGSVGFGGDTADHLQKVDLNEFRNKECRNFYKSNRRLTNGIVDGLQICAGEDSKDTCQGDSGGPLQVRNQDYTAGHTIIGVTSFGKACGISTSPGVYTRVSSYIGWIESIVWPN